MAAEIGDIPCHGRIAVGEGSGKVDQPDIIEFRSADAFGLQNPEQARIMQILLGLDRQATQLLGLCRTGFQGRHQRSGALQHRLVIVDIIAGRTGLGSAIKMNDSIGHNTLPRRASWS